MQIVVDRGMDLAAKQMMGLNLHFVPLRLMLDGKTYVSGVDIHDDEFYKLLGETESYPITSQPSAGEFAELYRELAKTDPEILSIHISSGLSGTINAAQAGAAMVPEAKVRIIDSMTLSCPYGWQVEAAIKAMKAGWSFDHVLAFLNRIQAQCDGLFTLTDLKYLVHGGRISHMKGLLASLLSIKPVIGVDKVTGKYVMFGQEVTFKRAIGRLVDVVTEKLGEGTRLRVQLLHGHNLAGLEMLKDKLSERFEILWEPMITVAPVLGAHTGPSVVGLSVGPADLFAELN